MKNQLNILFSFLIISAIVACGGNTEQTNDTAENTHGHEHRVMPELTDGEPKVANEQAATIVNLYFDLKDALVQTDATSAQAAAKKLADAITESEEAFTSIKSNALAIANETDVEAQRTTFHELSDEVFQLTKAYDVSEATLYLQYCPMAFDDAGAYWIAKEEQIANPYFGDKMLRCGSVSATID